MKVDSGAVVIFDTSVFMNLLRIPHCSEHADEIAQQFKEYLRHGCILCLPMVVLIEAGNHVSRVADGNRRWMSASNFVEAVTNSKPPFTILECPKPEIGWLEKFPEAAKSGVSFVDLAIIGLWKKAHAQAVKSGRQVVIWTLDNHLTSYDSRQVGRDGEVLSIPA